MSRELTVRLECECCPGKIAHPPRKKNVNYMEVNLHMDIQPHGIIILQATKLTFALHSSLYDFFFV